MDSTAFEKKVAEITENSLKQLDPEKIQASIEQEIGQALLSVSMSALGFDYDSWEHKYKLPRDSYTQLHRENASLFDLVKDQAREKAATLMKDVDLSQVELNKADKNAIISAYRKARRAHLEKEAEKLALEDVQKMVKNVFEIVQEETKGKVPQKEAELVDLVFSKTEKESK